MPARAESMKKIKPSEPSVTLYFVLDEIEELPSRGRRARMFPRLKSSPEPSSLARAR